MQIVNFCNMFSSLGLKYMRMSCNHSKLRPEFTLSLINVRETSRWCTTSVIIWASFCRASLPMSWMTFSAMNVNCDTQRTTIFSMSPPPLFNAVSVFWHQSAKMAMSMTWQGYLGTHFMKGSSTTLPSSAKIFSMSTIAEFKCSPKESCMSFSTLDSHALIAGSSAILMCFTKPTTSFSREVIDVSTSGWPSSVCRDAMPANILPKCRLTQPTSLELPIISSKSSSPTK
mmetsp:Transcript_125260/g.362416  ORF Transcript_125260/g.362416 Transcript_125260/m.362416 type:complete len:229 (-) Transcript_125260:3079-3765(-)